jgi:hypothetical protein
MCRLGKLNGNKRKKRGYGELTPLASRMPLPFPTFRTAVAEVGPEVRPLAAPAVLETSSPGITLCETGAKARGNR